MLRHIDVDGDVAVAMKLLHGARQRGHDRRNLGQRADDGEPRREPRAFELARHLVAHDVGLLAAPSAPADRRRAPPPRSRSPTAASSAHARDCRHACARARQFRGWHRSAHWSRAPAARSLPEIRPRAARRGRSGWRRDCARCASAAPGRSAPAAPWSTAARRVSAAKGCADGAIEAARFVVDFGGVARHRDQVVAVVAEIDIALDQPQPLILGALRIALAVLAGRRASSASGRRGRLPSHSERDECTSLLVDRAASLASTSPTAAIRTAARRSIAEICRRLPPAKRHRPPACADRRRAAGRKRARPHAGRASTARCR